MVSRFGWRLYRTFFKTYTEKVWGVPGSEMPADWAAQRVKNLSSARRLRNAILPKRNQKDITSLIEEFQYPKYGPGMMWERCADLVEEGGGKVVHELRVTSHPRDDGGAQAVTVTLADGIRTRRPHPTSSLRCRSRPSCGPWTRHPRPRCGQPADDLHYRDFLTVALVVPESAGFPDNWIYIHATDVKVGRIQNFGSWSPYMVKDGRTCLGMEYFVFEGDELWTSSDEELVARATSELQSAWAGVGTRRRKRLRRADAQGLPLTTSDTRPRRHHRGLAGGQRPERAPGRPQRHAQVQQSGPFHVHGHAHGREHPRGAHDIWAVNVEEEYHEAGEGRGMPAPVQAGTLRSFPAGSRPRPRPRERAQHRERARSPDRCDKRTPRASDRFRCRRTPLGGRVATLFARPVRWKRATATEPLSGAGGASAENGTGSAQPAESQLPRSTAGNGALHNVVASNSAVDSGASDSRRSERRTAHEEAPELEVMLEEIDLATDPVAESASMAPAVGIPVAGGPMITMPEDEGATHVERHQAESFKGGILQAGPVAVAGLLVNGLGVVVVVLIARLVSPRAYGTIAILLGLFFVLSMPGSAVLVGVVRRVTIWQKLGEEHRVHPWALRVYKIVAGAVVVEAVVVWVAKGRIAHELRLPNTAGVFAILVAAGIWMLLSVDRGLLQSHRDYRGLAGNLLIEGGMRSAFVVGLVAAGFGVAGYGIGIFLGEVVAAAHARWLASRAWPAIAPAGTGAAPVAMPEPSDSAPPAPAAPTASAIGNPGTEAPVVRRRTGENTGGETTGVGLINAGPGSVNGRPPLASVARRALLYDVLAAFIGLALLALLQNVDVLILGRQAGNFEHDRLLRGHLGGQQGPCLRSTGARQLPVARGHHPLE